MSPGDREDIREHASRHLEVAVVRELLPTPVDRLVEAAGLREDPTYAITESAIAQMPLWMAKYLRSAKRKIEGVIDRRERVIQVDETLRDSRRNFVKLHEVGHDILPWQHELKVVAETWKTLTPQTEQLFEQQANQCAAELLFQTDFLQKVARDYPVHIATSMELSELFGASRRATFRHWVSGVHASACGFLVSLAPAGNKAQYYSRLECSTSASWVSQFSERVFPKKLPVAAFPFLSGLGQRQPLDMEWTLCDTRGEPRVVRVQSYCNRYNHFILVWLPGKESRVAKLRKKPTLVLPGQSQTTFLS